MPSNPGPTSAAEALARERLEARKAGDYTRADALRDRITDLGFDVADRKDGFELIRREAAAESYPTHASVPAAYAAPDTCGHSLCIAFYGWPDDVERLVTRVLAGSAPGQLEVVLAVVAGDPGQRLLELSHPGLSRSPFAVSVGESLGHAQALTAAARRATGRLVHFVEPSLEAGWEVLEKADSVLRDPAVGACGPFGLVTEDWRDFQSAPAGEVMALEYLLSLRRADLPRIGEMDPGFRFYRNLDIDFSRQVVAAGLGLRSFDASVRRHAHRLWESTPSEDRDRLSRRNFNRLLDHWVRPGAPGS